MCRCGWGAIKVHRVVPSLVAQAPVSETDGVLCFGRQRPRGGGQWGPAPRGSSGRVPGVAGLRMMARWGAARGSVWLGSHKVHRVVPSLVAQAPVSLLAGVCVSVSTERVRGNKKRPGPGGSSLVVAGG